MDMVRSETSHGRVPGRGQGYGIKYFIPLMLEALFLLFFDMLPNRYRYLRQGTVKVADQADMNYLLLQSSENLGRTFSQTNTLLRFVSNSKQVR